MSEEIQLDATSLPGMVNELNAPELHAHDVPTAELEQVASFGEKQKVFLYDNGLLAITNPKRPQEVKLIRSGMLQVKPRSFYYVSRWVLIFALIAFSGVSSLWFGKYIPVVLYSFVNLVIAIACVSKLTYCLEFKSICGDVTVMKLRAAFYRRKVLQRFAELIARKSQECDLAGANLPILVQEHRRLVKDKIISNQDYERAKKKIFSNGSDRIAA